MYMMNNKFQIKKKKTLIWYSFRDVEGVFLDILGPKRYTVTERLVFERIGCLDEPLL